MSETAFLKQEMNGIVLLSHKMNRFISEYLVILLKIKEGL